MPIPVKPDDKSKLAGMARAMNHWERREVLTVEALLGLQGPWVIHLPDYVKPFVLRIPKEKNLACYLLASAWNGGWDAAMKQNQKEG